MFEEGAEEVVKRAKETQGKGMGYGLEEMKVLVELCFSEKMGSSDREESVGARRGLADRLLVLSESMWNA